MQNLWYLVGAYGVIWAVLFVYVFSIARRQQRLAEELRALESEVAGDHLSETDEAGREGLRREESLVV